MNIPPLFDELYGKLPPEMEDMFKTMDKNVGKDMSTNLKKSYIDTVAQMYLAKLVCGSHMEGEPEVLTSDVEKCYKTALEVYKIREAFYDKEGLN